MTVLGGLPPSLGPLLPAMESRKEKDGRMAVPQFGGWDQKNKGVDFSMVFARARANKKQHKKVEVERPKIAKEEELVSREKREEDPKKKRLLSYLNGCIKA